MRNKLLKQVLIFLSVPIFFSIFLAIHVVLAFTHYKLDEWLLAIIVVLAVMGFSRIWSSTISNVPKLFSDSSFTNQSPPVEDETNAEKCWDIISTLIMIIAIIVIFLVD